MSDATAPSASSSTGVVPARDAATLMLVRDGDAPGRGLEVCMLRRHLDSDFVGGAYVFPGGKVDDEDRSAAAAAVCAGRTDEEASRALGIERGGLAFWVAALRECFEEAGVLLARPAGGGAQLDVAGGRLRGARDDLNAGTATFVELCARLGVVLSADAVAYFSHWITPEGAPKRYDTRFFVAALPPAQTAVHDDFETVATVWVRPAEALARHAAGEFDLIFPTIKNLEAIATFATADELLRAAAAVERVETVLPKVVVDGRGFRILLPGDEGYAEAVGAGPVAGADPALVSDAIRSIGADGRGGASP